jgi:hypothetical protein
MEMVESTPRGRHVMAGSFTEQHRIVASCGIDFLSFVLTMRWFSSDWDLDHRPRGRCHIIYGYLCQSLTRAILAYQNGSLDWAFISLVSLGIRSPWLGDERG